MNRDELDAIRERADAATGGPWVHGDRWHIQGASHCHCAQYGPLIHEGRMDINGRMMQAHVHERERKWLHGIYALPSGGTGWHPLNVVNDTDEYGYMDDFDADFIAHARDDVPALLAEVERLRAGIKRIEPILSLLHHRGLVDSQYNREDVKGAVVLCHDLIDPTEGETDE